MAREEGIVLAGKGVKGWLQGHESSIPVVLYATKKYVKDLVEIHNIKQRDGETLKDFMKRFKIETGRMKGAPECMRISRFMHGINNPELTKRLNEHVPKIMEEMMIATTAFIREEAAAASKKKGHGSWKPHDQSKKHKDKRPDFRESNGPSDYITDGVQRRDYMAARTTETPGDHRRRHPFYQSMDELYDCQFVVTLQRSLLVHAECTLIDTSSLIPREKKTRPTNHTVPLHPNFPDQEMVVEGSLSDKRRTELCALLKKNLDIFAWQHFDMTGVPRSIAEHKLNIREGCLPVRQKKRGQAPERTKAIQAEVQKLIEARIMRAVYYHDWLSNPVMVKKHDGSWRMCVDFTDLNKACPQDCYPLAEIDWKVESLCGYPFKCFLDAYKGYHQIQLAAADKEKTAFHTRQGVYRYTKMPFGLKNASATYQRLMDKAFESQMGRNIEVYVDDLVVKSHTEAKMVRDIEETFQTLRKINMKLNPKKCSFGLAEGVFLGYVITPEGIKPCSDKTTAVLQLPSPQVIKEVQSLNGKLASLNRFLSKSAKKSLPLFQTLKKCIKKSEFRWTTQAEQAFQQLKQHLSNLPLLAVLKPQEELIMYLSATHGAISTVRLTERGTAQTPVYFISRVLQGPELSYSPMEKLVLSLVFAAKRLRRYFQAHPITVITDQPNKQVMSRPDVAGRLQKWSIMFGEHNITYRPRTSIKGQILADFLNEIPCDASQGGSVAETQEEPWTLFTDGSSSEYEALIASLRIATQMGVKNIQANVDSKLVANQVLGTYMAKEDNMIKYLDITKGLVLVEVLETKSITGKEVTTVIDEEGPTWMTELVKYLKEGILPGDEKEAQKLRLKARQYELMEGILYKRSFLTPWLKYVGPLQEEYVMKEIHEGSCSMHAGPRSVVAKAIRLGYFWPTTHKDAHDMIRKCIDCQIHRPVTRHPQQPLTPITAPWPFYKWGIDIAGPFPEGPRKVKFMIVAMDYFTKWVEAKEVAMITGGQVKKFVWDNIVCRFERANRSLWESIKARLGEGNKNWVEELPHVLWAHRTMIKSSHGDTPFSLTYGTKAVIPAEIGMPTYRTTAVDVVNNNEELRLNLDLLEERWELAAMSEARVRGVAFKPGDFVYRSNDTSHAVAGGKLGPKWEGPYEVIDALRNGAYKLRSMDEMMLPRTWNVTNLKRCCNPSGRGLRFLKAIPETLGSSQDSHRA
nr:reverse transcriptase domain-containing protein [Tanacetum cinerariifolium]